jgi:Cellulase (glycosyl hydrolase family 5)
MRRLLFAVLLCSLLFTADSIAQPSHHSKSGTTLVFSEANFPGGDASGVASAISGAKVVDAEHLSAALGSPSTDLLVMTGSAFPEDSWSAIFSFLQRGGNLVALGGRPFSQAAYKENGKWMLRPERNVFIRSLMINDYTPTPGSKNLQFEANKDFAQLDIPKFDWNRAYSLTIKLSAQDLYPRQGSTGSLDAVLHTLAWGTLDAHHMSAPLVEIDHLQNAFVGGRWEILAAELPAGFFGSDAGHKLVATLTERASVGAEDFTVRPNWALFLPGEPIGFQFMLRQTRGAPTALRLELNDSVENGKPVQQSFNLTPGQFPYLTQITMPAATERGLHTVTATLYEGDKVRGVYRTGFWIRDLEYLNSGPKVALNKDFFEIDGKTVPVMGTTYMSSDVQRDFFFVPNAYVWDQDFADMQRNGVNMIRTGLWSGWDQAMKESGVMHEDSMRNFEAFLMTARRHNIPVQFNIFAFLPEIFGGTNPYLDPHAIDRQRTFVAALADRFKNAPYVMWDIINEPSFDKPEHPWATRAQGDGYESALWNEFLAKRYPDRGALAAAWNTTPQPTGAPIAAPSEQDFSIGGVTSGGRILNVHDFYLFAQQEFTNWVITMRDTIRNTGSKQIITIGQDEGGVMDRLNPSFWGSAVDFTTNHPYWQNDALLWDCLAAKYPGKPLLMQEVGIQNDFNLDGTWRLDAEGQANLVDRKFALAMATSAGSIEWLWNVNSYMTLDQEVTIGMVRADGTDKPEVARFREMAAFAKQNADLFRNPELPQVAIVTSQAQQYSVLTGLATMAQQKSVRIIHDLGTPAYMVAENLLPSLGTPKLVIVPSPQALSDSMWQALLAYANGGGTVLITGSMERDAHWLTTHRLKDLGVPGERVDLTFRSAMLKAGSQSMPVSYQDPKLLDALRFADGATWKEIVHGKGLLIVTAFPVEFAEGNAPTEFTYQMALQRAGVGTAFTKKAGHGVLIRPTLFADAVLYVFVSESEQDEVVDIADKTTGAQLNFTIPAQRSRLVLLSRKTGKEVARYGF